MCAQAIEAEILLLAIVTAGDAHLAVGHVAWANFDADWHTLLLPVIELPSGSVVLTEVGVNSDPVSADPLSNFVRVSLALIPRNQCDKQKQKPRKEKGPAG